MAVPNLAPNYLSQVKNIRAEREENERNRAFEADQASKQFLRTLGRDVLGAALGVGADIAGTKFRDYLAAPERLSAQGVSTYDDSDFGDQGVAIRKAAEARATAELRPAASFGEAAESGFGRRGIDVKTPTLGGTKATALQTKPAAPTVAPTPAAPPATAPKPSNMMLTPSTAALLQRVIDRPVAPIAARASEPEVARPAIRPPFSRNMEKEAPQTRLPPTQGDVLPAAASMPPRMASDAREAPGGYAQPQITLGERALLSNEEGVRAALPYMSPVAQGLEQQAMFVRDERALKLDLMRKKLLSEEQQATANVQMLQRRGAHYSEIAAAKMREAVARERSEQMRQLDLALSAQRRTLPVRVKGVGTVTPRFGVDLSGDTADGLYGEIVPQSAMVGARSGGGGPRQPAPGEMEGDAITLIWQKRDRKGNEVGPGQPTRNVLGPPLYRRVASNPVDAGFDSTESVNEYKAWYRQYNEALPSAKQGEPSALEQVRAAQEAMVRLLQSAQAKYGSDVDTTRGVFGYGEQDRAAKAVKDTEKLKEAEDQVIRAVKQQTKVIGSTMAELSKVGRAADVDPNEVARAMKSVANQMGNRVMVGQVPMMPQIYAMALEGQSPPSTVQQNATMREAYDKVTTAAATVRQKLREKAEFARAKKLQGLALQLQAAGVDDPVGTLERMGANLPAGFDMPPVAPAQAAAGAPVSTTGTRVAPVPTVQASSPDDLWNKIEMMRMNPNDKQALYEREAAARGWE